MDELLAISPIDGRYRKDVAELENYFSEFAFIEYKLKVEIEYFIALVEFVKRKLAENEEKILREIVSNFSIEDAKKIKEIEGRIKHDTKAIEYFLKEKINVTSLKDQKEMFHFGLTSYDIVDNAYSLMLRDALIDAILPVLKKLSDKLQMLMKDNKDIVMLARTHGQPASPTTVGKEFANFLVRVDERVKRLESFKFPGKLSGSVGNYNALTAAYPNKDWIKFSENFISNFGLMPKIITTQIMPKDDIVDFLNLIATLNNILLDLDKDMWLYISYDYFRQKTKEEEVGSSTMPHKVNPIDFENSEGNLEVANSLLHGIVNKIQISRLQRDLSDSTMTRNYGVVMAHSLLAYKNTIKGLEKIEPNVFKITQDLLENPEVISEGVQTVLRREGYEMPYEKLKELTRGKKVTIQEIQEFIKNLDISENLKQELLRLTPENYIGLAKELINLEK